MCVAGRFEVANVWLADQPVAEGLGDGLCRLIWKILHERVRYEERGPAVSIEAKKSARAR